jgi:hypothetical protein
MVTGNFRGEKGDGCVRLTASPPYVRRVSKKCESFEVSKPYAGILLLLIANFYYVNASRGRTE